MFNQGLTLCLAMKKNHYFYQLNLATMFNQGLIITFNH